MRPLIIAPRLAKASNRMSLARMPYARGGMCHVSFSGWQSPCPVPLNWYCGFPCLVLEYQLAETPVPVKWYWLQTPLEVLLITVKVHGGVGSHPLQDYPHGFLVLGCEQDVASPALEVLVASEVQDECGHELVVLPGQHVLLHVPEAPGISHGLAAGIEGAALVPGAERGIDEAQVLAGLSLLAESLLEEAFAGYLAVGMQAHWAVGGDGVVGVHFLVLEGCGGRHVAIAGHTPTLYTMRKEPSR